MSGQRESKKLPADLCDKMVVKHKAGHEFKEKVLEEKATLECTRPETGTSFQQHNEQHTVKTIVRGFSTSL